MRILVTGATGFLGGALIQALKDHHELIVLGRNSARCDQLRSHGYNALCADLTQASSLPDPRKIGQIDGLVHCAALSAPWGPREAFADANVRGTQNTLDLAERLNVPRFVHISSPTVTFELKDQISIDEEYPLPRPINDYARTKALAEKMVLERTELAPIILRPRGIYGAGEESLLPRLLRAAAKDPLPLMRRGAAAIDLTHVSDVVRAIEMALLCSRSIEGEIFHISGGQMVSVRSIVERCCSRCNVHVRWRALPFGPTLAAARMIEWASYRLPSKREPSVTPYTLGLFSFRQSLDISKANRLLGWRPSVDFEDGFEDATRGWQQ